MILIVSQIIGFAAVALYLLSFQLKKRGQIVWATCLSNVLYVLQYVLLGAFSGAILDGLSAISSFFAAKKNTPKFKKHSKWIAITTFALIVFFGVLMAVIQRDFIELLPIAGSLLQTGGLWAEDEQKIRKFGLACAPFWLAYNYISRAYGAAFGSVLTMISSIVGLVRYRKVKKQFGSKN